MQQRNEASSSEESSSVEVSEEVKLETQIAGKRNSVRKAMDKIFSPTKKGTISRSQSKIKSTKL